MAAGCGSDRTFFASGARGCEISNIKADSVNLNTGFIKIMEKGGKERYIQIASTEILGILRKYYHQNAEVITESGFFFVNNRGSRYTEQLIRPMLKKYTKLAGIERNIIPPKLPRFIYILRQKSRRRF